MSPPSPPAAPPGAHTQEGKVGKLWGGRFDAQTDALMDQFQNSIRFDRRLYRADILGSQAYARALQRANLLTEDECQQIARGLDAVLAEFESGTFELAAADEDIHTAVERRLGELIGPTSGKLHTGRSRNDQVATDTRLYLLEQIATLDGLLVEVQRAISGQAEAHLDALMPGYTHLQPAQPILFAHWLMSYFWMLQRDRNRLSAVRERTSVLPLGASALAGNAFDIDCHALARDLGFAAIAENSIDAVSDRDFVTEFLFWAALLQVHLSRIAEDLVLWSTPAYGFVQVDERYATGSSIMPQKRNPDALELLRAKTGRLTGDLVAVLTVLKGTPSSYNKDYQEDKEPLFDAIDTLLLALPVAAGAIGTLHVREDAMADALDDGLLATELADYMVSRGVPFRESHHLVGRAVRLAEQRGCALRELPLESYRALDERFDRELYAALDHRRAVARRQVPCGTGRDAVEAQIARAREEMARR
ncbi:MAG: argininosuccinate lyase [Anaerolineae bacterium]|nr:argininosuccinate lyase [Anaerolineae bacterium]